MFTSVKNIHGNKTEVIENMRVGTETSRERQSTYNLIGREKCNIGCIVLLTLLLYFLH